MLTENENLIAEAIDGAEEFCVPFDAPAPSVSEVGLDGGAERGGTPMICVTAGKLPDAADQAKRALIENEAGVYARGTSLVRVITLAPTGTSTEGITRPAGASVIVPFD